MDSKRILIPLLVLAFPLVSCGDGEGHLSNQSCLTLEAERESKIYLELGSDKAIDVRDYVAVYPALPLEVTAKTANIRVSGTHVTGIDYGPFSVLVTCGDKSLVLEGEVISKAKRDLMDFLEGTRDSYIAYDNFSLFTLVGEGFYATTYSMDASVTTYQGGIEDPATGYGYPFLIASTTMGDYGDVPTFGDIGLLSGYERTKASLGFGSLLLSETDFEEVFDSASEATGTFILKANEGEILSEKSASFYTSLLGSSSVVWNHLSSYGEAEGVSLSIKKDHVSISPLDKKGNLIPSVIIGSYSFPTEVALWDIGGLAPSAILSWQAKPDIPLPVERGEIESFFGSLKDSDNFTMSAKGHWFNPDTGVDAATPSGMIFGDTKTEIFNVFETESRFKDGVLETTVLSRDDAVTLFSSEVPSSGRKDLYLPRKKGPLDTLDHYVDDPSKEETGYVYQSASSKTTNVWQTPLMPGKLVPQGSSNLWEGASFRTREVEEGKSTFVYTPTGLDMSALQVNALLGGIPYVIETLVPHDLAYCGFLYLFYFGWAYDSSSWTIEVDADSFSFHCDFLYSSTLYYGFELVIDGIGSTTLSPEAEALR